MDPKVVLDSRVDPFVGAGKNPQSVYKKCTCTPASNLGYLAAPRTNFHMCQIVYWNPLNAKQSCSKKLWYGLCENAWFLWQPIANLRMGGCLQNYSSFSCYLS